MSQSNDILRNVSQNLGFDKGIEVRIAKTEIFLLGSHTRFMTMAFHDIYLLLTYYRYCYVIISGNNSTGNFMTLKI